MSETKIPEALVSLKGSRLVEITPEEHVWYFRFDPPFTLSVECVWRVTSEGRIVVTDEDHNQMFGLPEPVDAADLVRRTVGASLVADVALRGPSSDLIVTFANGASLEVLSNSSAYENWHFFAADGREGRVLGGGRLQA
jgi:hypothetical protein